MITIHIQRTEARTYCDLDPREPAPEGSRFVTEAKYDRAAVRFAAGVVPGACHYCLVQRAGVAVEAAKAARKARRAAKGPHDA